MTDLRRIIVDTDTGIDDALALLYLAAQPEVRIEAITAVYGNCVVDDSVRNIAHILRLVGQEQVPVARGEAKPLNADPHIAHYVHGYDGLGDVVTDERPDAPAVLLPDDAARTLVDLARANPGELELLTLGPLTNVARALQLEPQLLTLLKSITIMGGCGPFPPLGVSEMVDANIQNDGDAADIVFKAPANRRLMVGVNVTRTVITDEQDVVALHRAASPRARFAADILESYMDFYRLAWGRRVSPVHDGLAAALMLHPEYITEQATGPVNITRDGFATRGRVMLTAQGRPVPWPIEPAPDTTAVVQVDVELFHRRFLDALLAG